MVRLPQRLHEELTSEAHSCGCSLNQLVVSKLSKKSFLEDSTLLEIIKLYSPRAIIQFGSTTRGEATATSDIDLLIILDPETPIERNLYLIWEQKLPPATKYSPQFVHLPVSQNNLGGLWLEAALEGEILFTRDRSIREFISSVKNRIAQGQYVRKWTHGQPYWTSHSYRAEDQTAGSKRGHR